jgi:hypothetical protein
VGQATAGEFFESVGGLSTRVSTLAAYQPAWTGGWLLRFGDVGGLLLEGGAQLEWALLRVGPETNTPNVPFANPNSCGRSASADEPHFKARERLIETRQRAGRARVELRVGS